MLVICYMKDKIQQLKQYYLMDFIYHNYKSFARFTFFLIQCSQHMPISKKEICESFPIIHLEINLVVQYT